ncbi:hypothetical protein ABL78_5833 [Leptomonas seymouri]|uniref:Uncharacterized protein n=1 Tax=Leptomonas seymouri TaxID=5684 RepID=A0A0N1PAD1_LEPSE|nr:hypothetical protein ABL78_5833 [Leptomonas seymouri]|eukprot:KPI85108.1 hypothetical protein ABL78_5833 [Leptomonas seymouri]
MSESSLSPSSAFASPFDRADSAFTPTSLPSRLPGADRFATKEEPNELLALKRRSRVLQAERDRYQQLGQRAADVFEEHRRDLTQLAQKERAIRGQREDALRNQLQDTLKENRELMARVVEQRRQHDDACRAELQGHRDASAKRHAELEVLLTQLHTERAELQRSVAGAERTQYRYCREIEVCLEEQRQLQEKVRRLRDGLEGALEEKKMEPGRDWSTGEQRDAVHEPMQSRCSRRSRQLCCEYCDVPQNVWAGPSPTRRVPRRRFVPAGPWDACCASRASSPTTHHIDAVVSNIERENYLRPRLYLQRCGRDVFPLLITEPSSCYGESLGADKRAASPYCSAASRSHPRPRHRSRSQGLSSTTTSSTCGSDPSFSSSSSSSNISVPNNRHTKSEQARHSTCRMQSRERIASSRRVSRFSPQPRSTGLREEEDARCHHLPYRHKDAQSSPLLAATSAAAGHDAYSGLAINVVCHSLISDLADTRAEYQRYQQQMRDPHGDSVEASQQMRRLMRQMDDKLSQIRTLRKEQEKHRDTLRVHDVLQQVMAENRYCEAVYKDLMELIRA